jgi:hypothetical protein
MAMIQGLTAGRHTSGFCMVARGGADGGAATGGSAVLTG